MNSVDKFDLEVWLEFIFFVEFNIVCVVEFEFIVVGSVVYLLVVWLILYFEELVFLVVFEFNEVGMELVIRVFNGEFVLDVFVFFVMFCVVVFIRLLEVVEKFFEVMLWLLTVVFLLSLLLEVIVEIEGFLFDLLVFVKCIEDVLVVIFILDGLVFVFSCVMFFFVSDLVVVVEFIYGVLLFVFCWVVFLFVDVLVVVFVVVVFI